MNRVVSSSSSAGALAALAVFSLVCLLLPLQPACAEGGTWPPVGQLAGSSPADVAVQGSYAYCAASLVMTVIDLSVPWQPHMVGWCDTLQDASSTGRSMDASAIAVSGTHAYVGVAATMYVVDVADPVRPLEVGHCTLPQRVTRLAAAGAYVYVADGAGGLQIVDASVPEAPHVVGSCSALGWSHDVAIAGGYAYVAAGGGIHVISIADPTQPAEVGSWGDVSKYVSAIAVSGGYAYAAGGSRGFYVVDVSSPATPVEVSHSDVNAREVAVAGGYAYVGSAMGMYVMDISDPMHPTETGFLHTGEVTDSIAIHGDFLCVVQGEVRAGANGELAVVDVSDPTSPVQTALLDSPWMYWDLTVWSHYLYTGTGSMLQICDASDPANLIDLGRRIVPGDSITVSNGFGYAFGNAESEGPFYVLTLSDPTHPAVAGWCLLPELTFPYDIAVAGDYAYVAGDGGFSVVKVSVPSSPAVVSTPALGGEGVAVAGGYLYVAGYDLLQVADVSTPANPVLVGTCSIPGWANDVAVSGAYAYVAADTAGLRVINISNPASPIEVGHCDTPGRAMGVAVSGNYAYVGAGASGLRVIDISHPANPVEVAYWDTPGHSRTVVAADGYVYLADLLWGIVVFREYVPSGLSGQVRVRGTSTNIAGARVEAGIGGILKRSAITSANGIYSIANLAAGTYSVTARKRGYISQTKAGIPVMAGQTSYANCGLEPSESITGQVRDRATAAVIAGATVTASLGGQVRATGTTAANGVYVLDSDVPAGTYVVSAAKTGYVTKIKANITVTQSATSYVNFSLEPAVLRGQVKAAGTGANLEGAIVAAYQGDMLTASASTNASGVYEIGGLAAGSYTVIASKVGYVRQTKLNITIAASSVTYVNFSLAASGKLKGQFKDKVSGAPLIGATVVARTGGIVWGIATTTGPYGIYEIASDLPAGTYVVGASKTGYLSQVKKDIVVTAGATSYVNFNLAVGGPVSPPAD